MAEGWKTMTAADVRPGDRIRLSADIDMLVSRIEPDFMGRKGLIAFIEDTPGRWFKQPMLTSSRIDVMRPDAASPDSGAA
jgi:hypothetical protein